MSHKSSKTRVLSVRVKFRERARAPARKNGPAHREGHGLGQAHEILNPQILIPLGAIMLISFLVALQSRRTYNTRVTLKGSLMRG